MFMKATVDDRPKIDWRALPESSEKIPKRLLMRSQWLRWASKGDIGLHIGNDTFPVVKVFTAIVNENAGVEKLCLGNCAPALQDWLQVCQCALMVSIGDGFAGLG